MESSAAMKKSITNSSFLRALLGAVLLIGIAPTAIAANRLVDVKYHAIVDHQLELELIFESAITSPTVNLSAVPAEIILNFTDTISSLNKEVLPIDNVGVKQLTAQQQGSELQVIVALNKVKP